MKRIFVQMLLLVVTFFGGLTTNAQTTVFSDDFGSNQNATYTTAAGAIGSSTTWSLSLSGADWGARINTTGVMEITNDASATTNVAGWAFANHPLSGYAAPFVGTLKNNSGLVTWTFNMRTSRTSALAGFTGTTSYGMAYILAGTSNAVNNTGNGYAVVMGGGGTNTIALISYNNGLLGTKTTIIGFGGAPAALTNYMSVKVTYDPSNDNWTLSNRDDGTTAFADPASGTLTQIGAATANNTYTSTAMTYSGAYWQGSTGAGQVATFDNSKVVVNALTCTPPTTGATASAASNVQQTQFDANWTRGNGNSVIVVVRLASTTAVAPTNGTSYTAGTFGGTSTTGTGNYVVYNGTGTTTTVTGLTAGTNYVYDVYEFNTTGTCYAAASSQTVTTAGSLPACTAPNAVTATALTATSGTQINGTITPPTGGADGYAVFYSTSAQLPIPTLTSGTTYSSANAPTGLTFLQSGTATTFSATGLANGTIYYFYIYPYTSNANCSGGPVYAAGFEASQPTWGNCVAPSPATSVTVTGNTQSSISGSISGGSSAFIVFVSTSNTAPVLTNGVSYTAANAPSGYIFVQKGTATAFTATGLNPGTQYYTYVFAYNNLSCLNGPAYSTSINTTGTTSALTAVTHLVISQIYGGGGNTGATYNQDFVEIYNPTTASVDLSTYTVQYQSATGTTFNVNGPLTGTIAPGKYYLVGMASGAIGGALPTPDFIGTSNLSGSDGKVILANKTTAVTDCNDATIVDKVGYGTTSVVCNETVNASNLSIDATRAFFRAANGCVDTDHNFNDFSTLLVAPRNAASPANNCGVLPACAEPTAQPTALVLTPSVNSVSGSFTASSPAADKYLIVRSTSATLSATPAGGTTYTAGQALGGGTVVGYTNTTSFTDNSLTQNTQYYYFVFAANDQNCTGGPNYLITSPLSGNTTTLLPACTEPTAQPTALVLTPSVNSVSGSFTASSPAADKYLIVRSTSATLSATPADGTTYTAGQALGGGTVVGYTNTTSFTDNSLTQNTQYYYFVFAANDQNCTGGPKYLITSPLSGNTTTLLPACTEPTAQPTGLVLTPSVNSVSGSFTASSPAADKYLIVRSTSATLSATPADGTTYTAGQALGGGTVVGYTNTTSYTDNSLVANTQYYYFVFAANDQTCTGGPNYLTVSPLSGNTTTLQAPCAAPAAQPTNLVLSPSSNSVGGTFTASSPAADKYIVVRSTSSTLSATPANGTVYTVGQSLGGGTVVAYGNATTFTDNGLSATTQYYYFVFALNDQACTGGPAYLTASPLSGNTTTTNTPCTTPTAQPTSLTLTPAATSISGTFVAASPAADKYLVVRSTASTLSANPVDGTVYIAGQSLGGGVVVSYTNTNSFTDNGLSANTQYYYFVFAANDVNCAGGPKYFTTSPLSGNTTTLLPACAAPAAQPTALVLTPATTSVSGSFIASSPAANKYLVVRSTTSTLSATPANGTTYTAGQSLGGGTVVSYGATTTFTDNGLTANTQYYYFVFAANDVSCTGGPAYLATSPLTNNTTTLLPACAAPAAQPTALVLMPATTSVSGSFTASSPAANKYLVVRSTSSTLSATPANGTTYTAGQLLGGGTVVSYGATTTFTDNGLTANTQYYYFVFAANDVSCTGGPAYLATSPLTNNATTLLPACAAPAAQPTALVLTPATTSVTGSFTASSPAANKYLVVRSTTSTLSATPANGTTYTAGQSLGGGTVVSYGATTTFTDNGLTANTQYYYFVFAANDVSCTGGSAYLTTSPLTNNTTTLQPACTAPVAPTSLVLTPASTSVSGSFTASSPTANKYLVVRSTSATLSASPVSGTTYTVGQSLGGGTVVSYGTSTTFTDNGLTASTQYYYFVFGANDVSCAGGPVYSPSLTGNTTTTAPATVNHLVISQIYGGGGNTSATYNQDFVEIFNPTGASINISGYTIQYQSSAGTTWAIAGTGTGSLAPGQYFLFGLATGTTGAALPATPDATSTTNISGTSGKLILINKTTAATDCTDPLIVDKVGFGTTTNICNETGNVATTSIDNTKAMFRLSNGCIDTDNNTADFTLLAVSPRNTASPINICSGGTPCAEPTAQPTALVLTPSSTSVSGTFTAAVPAPAKYLVVRSTSATLSTNPVDGTTYTVGQALGGGVVVSYSATTTFTDNGLTAGVQYYYFVFSANDFNCVGGPNYLVTAPLSGNTTTTVLPCTTPSAQPTAFNLVPSATSVSGSFAVATGVSAYLVVYSTASSLSVTPVNGTTYTVGQSLGGGTVGYFGTAGTFTVTGLNQNTQYYFFVFSANTGCAGAPSYLTTAPLAGNTTTTSTGIPAGYYTSATGLTCQPLKTALRNIISTGYQDLTYTPGLWNLFPYSDKRLNDAGTATVVWDMYSDNPTGADPYTFTFVTNQCGNYSQEGDCYNREHAVPQSWFASAAPMVSDAHHIFPTDGYVNGRRSNNPFGLVSTATWTSSNGTKLGTGNNNGYTGTVWEPRNEFKGDFARAVLYMAVRYENEIISQNWAANSTANNSLLSMTDQPDAALRRLLIFDNWYLQTLITWHNQDPVSQKEIDRNNAIYYQAVNTGAGTFAQGNRNPFVDHPEYVALIFSSTCTSLPACTEPTAQPTALVLTPTTTGVTGSFTATSPAATKYLVVRSTSATLGAAPADGTVYSAGQTFGSGVVVSFGSTTTFTDNGLTNGTQYYYFVFAANDGNCSGTPNYLATSPLSGNTTTTVPACAAPSAPTALSLQPSLNAMSISFTPSSGNKYLVVRSTNATLTANPIAGTAYTVGQSLGGGTVVSYGTAISISDGSLNSNTMYYYFVFALNDAGCSGGPVYSTVLSAGAKTLFVYPAGIAPNPVKGMMHLKLANPLPTDGYGALIDESGRMVLKQRMVINNTDFDFDLKHVAPGRYFFHVVAGPFSESYQVLVIH